MKRNPLRMFFSHVSLSIFLFLSLYGTSNALISIEVHPEFDQKTIIVGADKFELKAGLESTNLTYEWRLEGPGRLLGNISSSKIEYEPPKNIKKDIESVRITVTGKTDKGYKDSGEISFNVIRPQDPPPPPERNSIWKYIAGGVGAAALVGGAIAIGSDDGGDGDAATGTTITIDSPKEGSRVNWISSVSGHSTGFAQDDYVTISIQPHNYDWFPQSSTGTIDSNGNWVVNNCYFGLEGDVDKGRAFRFKAELRNRGGQIKTTDLVGTVIRN